MSEASTLLSVALALAVAAIVGPLLSRWALGWFSGRGLTNLLIETRGALLPFLAPPLLINGSGLSPTLAVGLTVGVAQGVAIARWGARGSTSWSPLLMGALALGRSSAAALTSQALSRGAVVASLATTAIQVVLVEAVVVLLELVPPDIETVGGRLLAGAHLATPFLLLAVLSLTFLLELVASWLLQRRGA